jgi:hypothetical protein
MVIFFDADVLLDILRYDSSHEHIQFFNVIP